MKPLEIITQKYNQDELTLEDARKAHDEYILAKKAHEEKRLIRDATFYYLYNQNKDKYIEERTFQSTFARMVGTTPQRINIIMNDFKKKFVKGGESDE